MCDHVIARATASSRAVLQCADIILGEAPDLTSATWQVTCLLTRFPGCVVVAVRHAGGRWCVIGPRDRESWLLRPGFGTRIGWAALAVRAAEAVTP
ncbi:MULTISPECIES: hypothetical protein [Amycolatopsis]|uniref:hypothetical protein n=1 Tax=Amycolatopsis TaxID=1813 RepID=UPI0013042ED1|nr:MULTISPECIES: hypothetical protein [Amycolatopsis]